MKAVSAGIATYNISVSAPGIAAYKYYSESSRYSYNKGIAVRAVGANMLHTSIAVRAVGAGIATIKALQ